MSYLALDGIEIYMKANMKLEQENAQLRARVEKLEVVIKAVFDGLVGSHSGPCDGFGVCLNCTLFDELESMLNKSEVPSE